MIFKFVYYHQLSATQTPPRLYPTLPRPEILEIHLLPLWWSAWVRNAVNNPHHHHFRIANRSGAMAGVLQNGLQKRLFSRLQWPPSLEAAEPWTASDHPEMSCTWTPSLKDSQSSQHQEAPQPTVQSTAFEAMKLKLLHYYFPEQPPLCLWLYRNVPKCIYWNAERERERNYLLWN